jgi:hypothetical protein
MSTTAPRADAAAASVGATDLFVLRRVTGERFVHVGGAGRGAGWAGLIEVGTHDELVLGSALSSRQPVRVAHPEKEHVFGPYFANVAAVVAVTNDLVVVFGGDEADLSGATDESLQNAALLAADAVGTVTPAKQLADELEELEAVRSVLTVDGKSVEEVMRALAHVASESLSCELGAVYLAQGNRIELVSRGWELDAEPASVAEALRGVLDKARFPYCVQDATSAPLPSPLDRDGGIRSYYLLELTGLARGVLLLAHTDAAPRGFTLLCRQLGARVAEVASNVAGLGLTREWTAAESARLQSEFAALEG